MNDIDADLRPLADGDRFLDGLEHLGSFVANVRRVNAAELGGRFAQRNQIVCRGKRARRHGHHRRQPHRAVLHRLADEFLHRGRLFGRRPRVRRSHDRFPNIVDADVGRDVDRRRGLLDDAKVVAERCIPPVAPSAAHHVVVGRIHLSGRSRRSSFAKHFGGDALANLALRAGRLAGARSRCANAYR